jgi:hypothetical protein
MALPLLPHPYLPLEGADRGRSTPLPPWAGEGWDGGEEGLSSPPPAPSPIKGGVRRWRA